MADVKEEVKFTLQEQGMASCALYTMSLICIIWGGIRSAQLFKKTVEKKRLMEGSITMKEAKKFPITASCVLFGLYIFFKPDGREWLVKMATTYLPAKFSDIISQYLSTAAKSADEAPSPTLFSKVEGHLPLPVVEILTYLSQYIPTVTKERVMLFLLVLLCFEGCVALAALLKPLFSFVLNRLPIGNNWPRRNVPYFFSLCRGKKEMEQGDLEDAPKKQKEYLLKIDFDTHDAIAIFFCLAVGISHIYKRHWITNNIIGMAFSIYGIENLHLSSFKAGTLLLAGLFVYDVFWVFATDVMTSVAKGIDAPILLQFPQDLLRNGWLDASKHSMLGLGDIVIPGIFIALLRRFDLRLMEQKTQNPKNPPKSRHYFLITIIAYALGLLITMGVMHFFKAAQPALLYLVPCCILIPMTVAFFKGEVKELWSYNEEKYVEKSDDADEEKKKK